MEIKVTDLETTKALHSGAICWTFTDFGTGQIGLSSGGLEGGFARTEEKIIQGGLLVPHHRELGKIKERVIVHGDRPFGTSLPIREAKGPLSAALRETNRPLGRKNKGHKKGPENIKSFRALTGLS